MLLLGLIGHFAGHFFATLAVLEVVDKEGAYRSGGTRGVWDADVRLSEMDREGIAAEFVYYGDHRAMTPFVDSAGRSGSPT